jgi:hypothetical protein
MTLVRSPRAPVRNLTLSDARAFADAIEASPHATAIKSLLASNTSAYQAADSVDEALDLLLSNLAQVLPADRERAISSHTNTTLIACGPRRLLSTVENTHLFSALIDLERYRKLWPNGGKLWNANSLHEWRFGVSLVRPFRARARALATWADPSRPVHDGHHPPRDSLP